jgi:DNA primase
MEAKARSRMRARADRVLEEVDLGEILQEYGYAVVPDRMREQQFSCDLHGHDNKPSARFYGHDNTTYCWVCRKKRDAINYVMEKELLDFREAVEYLEQRLGLDRLPWSDEGEAPRRQTPEEIVAAAQTVPDATYEEERDRLRRFLDSITRERDLDSDDLLAFWEVYDRIDYGVARQSWGEDKGHAAVARLRERVMQKLEDVG